MALSNAERQKQYRERVKKRLAWYNRLIQIFKDKDGEGEMKKKVITYGRALDVLIDNGYDLDVNHSSAAQVGIKIVADLFDLSHELVVYHCGLRRPTREAPKQR